MPACASFPSLFTAKGDGQVIRSPGETCVLLDPENRLHPVGACERAATYEVQVLDRRLSFDKLAFQRQFRERLWQFVRTTNYPWKTLKDATVAFWLTAPIFQPEGASFVAAVLSPGGNFALRLPLAPEEWRFETSALTYLGRSGFPSLSAWQAGMLVVTPRSTVTPAALTAFIGSSGALAEQTPGGEPAVRRVDGDGTQLTLVTAPFAEAVVARRLTRDRLAKSLLEDVRFVPAGEDEGYKARVFRFALGSGK